MPYRILLQRWSILLMSALAMYVTSMLTVAYIINSAGFTTQSTPIIVSIIGFATVGGMQLIGMVRNTLAQGQLSEDVKVVKKAVNDGVDGVQEQAKAAAVKAEQAVEKAAVVAGAAEQAVEKVIVAADKATAAADKAAEVKDTLATTMPTTRDELSKLIEESTERTIKRVCEEMDRQRRSTRTE